MPLLQTLLNAGVLPSDAQVLEAHFANEPDFLEGMEQIARALTTGVVNLLPPHGEPWCSIHLAMMNTGQPPDQAFGQVLGQWTADVQAAISGAIAQRMQDLQQWLQQQSANKKRKTASYLKALQNLGYSFRYNVCTHTIEVNSRPMTDPVAAEIRGKLRDIGIYETNIAEDAYIADAWAHRYHPVREYLTSLKFQGGDPITELAEHFDDEHIVFGAWLRRWLIGACARIMAGEQNRMLVLDGKQGLGKDHFAKWLASPLPEYFYEGPIMPDDKDHRLRLLSCWVWDVNELGSTTRRSDREALKAFLTIQAVRERKAYGRYDVQGQSITSFIGTVNNENGVLNDPTGHRRFMIAHLKNIDWGYTKIDVDQVWAQAFDLYLSGETGRLEGDELIRANEINEQYQIVDLVEETLKELFAIDPNDQTNWLSTFEIMEILKADNNGSIGIRGGGLKPGSEIDTRKLSSALTRLGLSKTDPRGDSSGKRRRGYYGIKRRMP